LQNSGGINRGFRVKFAPMGGNLRAKARRGRSEPPSKNRCETKLSRSQMNLNAYLIRINEPRTILIELLEELKGSFCEKTGPLYGWLVHETDQDQIRPREKKRGILQRHAIEKRTKILHRMSFGKDGISYPIMKIMHLDGFWDTNRAEGRELWRVLDDA
jgi:hypothetical protein